MKLDTIDLDQLETLITQSEQLTAKAVRKVMKRVAYDIQVAGTVQMVAAGPADSSSGPPPSPPFGALGNVYKYWAEALSELFSPLLTKAWNGGVNAAIRSLHDVTPEWEPPQVDPLMIAKLANSEGRIGNLATELWQHAQAEMIAGATNGDSIQQMAQRVSAAAQLSIPHATTIVRTEVISAANAGTFDLIELAGFSGRQEWLATNDPKTRLTHKQADGQKVEIGEFFTVGGYNAAYPGASSLPPAERYNCRCTVAYDIEEDDLVAALTAAGKWNSAAHPRDSKGKFVKKNLLTLLKHNSTEMEIAAAVNDLSPEEWNDLTPDQKADIKNEVGLGGAYNSVLKLDDIITKAKDLPTSNTAKKTNVGAPKKITHKDIHSPKKDGEVFAVSADGQTTVTWNDSTKKYTVYAAGGNPKQIPKSKLYDFMQGHEWNEPTKTKPLTLDMPPNGGTKAAAKKAKKTSKFSPPIKKVTAKKSAASLTTPPPPPSFVPKTNVNFTNFKKVGGQGGSNPGGVFEAPSGEDWYIKKAKTPQHAANEVAASAFYNAAGMDVPQVQKGQGALDIGGGLQTGTKIVPNAKKNLKSMLSNPAYKKQVQSGFAMDAWLANWDVAGLTFDNVVTGADGKPYRIDVGGALLYRAMGAPKGNAFGDKVTELDTFRDKDVNSVSAQIFGDMSLKDQRESAKKVQAITPDMIDQIVADSGLPSHVATTLKNRRQYILAKYDLLDVPADSTPTIDTKKDIGGPTVKKTFSPPPDDIDWEIIGEDINLGTHPPGTVIAHNDNGDYLEVQDNGEVGLYDANGSFVDATSASEVEVLTLSTTGWKEGGNETGDEMDFGPGVTTDANTVTSTAPDPDAPPGTISIWQQNEEVGGDTALTAYVTKDGKVFFKNHLGEVTPSNWKVESLEVEVFGFSKTWDNTTPDVPDTTYPLGPDGFPKPGTEIHGKPFPSIPDTLGAPGTVGGENVVSAFVGLDEKQPYFILQTDEGSFWAQSFGNWVKVSNGPVWHGPVEKLGDKVDVDEPVTPTVAATPTPVKMMGYDKIKAKQSMKAANLGYWSKPEKIWDVVKQIQTANPHPDNPGHSKFTPLQILEGLDEQLKTTKPNPYTEKIKKWLNTPAGKVAASDVTLGGPTPSTAPSPPIKAATKKAVKKVAGFDPDVAAALDAQSPNLINSVTPAVKNTVFDDFKAKKIYASSPPDMIYAEMKAQATAHKLSVLQIAKIIDEKGAQKAGVTNSNLYEKKLVAWAKTIKGTSAITGKAPPAPPVPELKFQGTIPTKAESDKMTYKVIKYSQAVSAQASAEAKWGAIKPAEKAGLRHFTGGNFTAINSYLRGTSKTISDGDLKHSLNAQQGFRPSTQPMLLHRGVGWDALGFSTTPTKAQLEAMIGKKGTHKGFSSTSVGGMAAFSGKPLLLVLEAPTGTPMAFVDPFSKNKGENEMLLPAGTDFEILSIDKYGAGKYGSPTEVRVRIIP